MLVKFNSVVIKDKMMDQYFKMIKLKPLMISNLVNDLEIPGNLMSKRVFIKQDYSALAAKLNAVYLKLR